jgi:hypothetical protein
MRGTLRKQRSGRWAICRPGERPVEITSGECFWVQIPGERALQQTRMEHDLHGYYSVDGYELRDGLRAGLDRA